LGHRNLDILDARIHTTRHGYALDSFVVLPASGEQDLRALATLTEHELAEHLQATPGNGQKMLAANPKRPSRLSQAFPFAPIVEIQPDEGSQHWRLAIVATNRPGLLSDIAQVFAAFNVSLETAKVMTLGERVEDVFVISGAPLSQPRTQRQFERAVYEALSQETRHVA